MVDVLCIGQYKEAGKFVSAQWSWFMEWCKRECDKVIIYSQMSYDIICTKFLSYCDIKELGKPDKLLNVHAYEIHVENIAFWDYIKNYNYTIDLADDISYIFFFYGEMPIASLEVVDFENYIIIEKPIRQTDGVCLKEGVILENIRLCKKGKSDIDSLLQEENWKPLGYEESV